MRKSQLQPKSALPALSSARADDASATSTSQRDNSCVRQVHPKVARQVQDVSHLYLTQKSDSRDATPSHIDQLKSWSGYESFKRLFDLVIGTPLLLVSLPVMIFAAIAIRLESEGSPIFIQTRLGRGGRPFKIVKLRGMYIDAPVRFARLYDYSSKENLDFCFHNEADPRVTPLGKFFRRTSIDELPNLWNVLIGDMSLVGPRPEIPEVMALYGSYEKEYLSVKPGVTCLSKCTGRDRLTKRETIEYDLQYARTRSFRLDCRILWRTFQGVVLRRDVF